MKYLTDEYIILLQQLLNTLDAVQSILYEIEITGETSHSKQIEGVYSDLFLSDVLKEHVDFKIAFVGRSTDALFRDEIDARNANSHISLKLKSKEAFFIDQLYDNKISDLLKFFKHLFATIENFTIYKNKKRIHLFQKLTEDIGNDISDFLSKNIEADTERAQRGKDSGEIFYTLDSDDLDSTEPPPTISFKPNWQEYLNLISEKGIEHIYHFTDEANLNSIKSNGGLYSWDFMERHNLEIPVPGGDDLSRRLDRLKGAQNYVRLSFCESHPMMHVMKNKNRIHKPRILTGSIELIYLNGTKYCNMNATKNEAVIDDELNYLRTFRFDLFNKYYPRLPEKDKQFYQSEILVKEFVPIDYIMNFHDPIIP